MKYVYDFLFYLVFFNFSYHLFHLELFSWQWFLSVFVGIVFNGITEKSIKEFLRDLGNS